MSPFGAFILVGLALPLSLHAQDASPAKPLLAWGQKGDKPGEFHSPIGIAISSKDEIFVTDNNNARIQRFSTDGKHTGGFDLPLDNPKRKSTQCGGIAIDKDGLIYLGFMQQHKIGVYSADGKLVREWGKKGSGDGEFNQPGGIVLLGDGTLIMADQCNHRIQKFTTDGKFLAKWGEHGKEPGKFDGIEPLGSRFGGPHFLAIDSKRRLYTTEGVHGRVQQFTLEGKHLAAWGDKGSQPGGFGDLKTGYAKHGFGPIAIMVDKHDRVWVSSLNDRVQAFTPEGKFLFGLGGTGKEPGQFARPHGMAMDSKGALYVCDAGNQRVQKFDAARSTQPTVFNISQRACLFLDDHFIAEQTGLKRTWHQGQPRPEVAIRANEPWEKWPHLFGSVLHDPKDGLFKMYYESALFPSLKPPDSFTCLICYAVSKDGKMWTKPKLGLHDFKGSKDNNIVLPHAELANVFVDPLAKDPSGRLKMFVYLQNHSPLKAAGEALASSGDGVHWKLVGVFNRPAYARPEQGNFTDSHHFSWDPLGKRYLAYVRTFDKSHVAEAKDGRRRAIGVTHCKELNRDWTPIVQVLAPDAKDDAQVAPLSKDATKPDWAEHYVMNIFTYGNHYLGLLSLLYLVDGRDTNGGGDLQLTFSHDGLAWHRQPERTTMISPSNAKGLVPTYASTNGPIEIGDELWLYYTEANGAHPIAPFDKAVSQIRAAVWRKDGFVSLDATKKGSLTTKPLLLDGKRLLLNVKTATTGHVRAAIVDGAGKEAPGFGLKDCEPIRGDQARGEVRWKGGDLSQFQGQGVQLRIELHQANIYSLRVSND